MPTQCNMNNMIISSGSSLIWLLEGGRVSGPAGSQNNIDL